jgi:uncharacterized membrane protein
MGMTSGNGGQENPLPTESGSGVDSSAWLRIINSGHLEYDRVVFFSDAVFAIAITLLAVDIRVPNGEFDAARELQEALPKITGFGISFAVIGLFWLAHHTIFRHIVAFDRRLMLINLLFLGTIAFLPYPTDLLSTSGQTAALIFYAAWVAAAGLGELAIWVYASHTPGLLTDRVSARHRRYFTLRMAPVPVVFLLSIPLALVAPASVVPYTWLLIWVFRVAIGRAYPLSG